MEADDSSASLVAPAGRTQIPLRQCTKKEYRYRQPSRCIFVQSFFFGLRIVSTAIISQSQNFFHNPIPRILIYCTIFFSQCQENRQEPLKKEEENMIILEK